MPTAFSFMRVSRERCHRASVQTTLPMLTSALRSSVTSLSRARALAIRTMDHDFVFTADDPKDAALQLLERWSAYPRSTWHALGLRRLTASHREVGRVAASQLTLEGVVAHYADSLDAWIIRDAAETAWWLAPRDRTSMPWAVENAARRAVLHAALAVLARSWLPPQDFNRLLARAVH